MADPENEFKDVRFTGGLDPTIILDIEDQISRPGLNRWIILLKLSYCMDILLCLLWYYL